jgi:hypothetical protein
MYIPPSSPSLPRSSSPSSGSPLSGKRISVSVIDRPSDTTQSDQRAVFQHLALSLSSTASIEAHPPTVIVLDWDPGPTRPSKRSPAERRVEYRRILRRHSTAFQFASAPSSSISIPTSRPCSAVLVASGAAWPYLQIHLRPQRAWRSCRRVVGGSCLASTSPLWPPPSYSSSRLLSSEHRLICSVASRQFLQTIALVQQRSCPETGTVGSRSHSCLLAILSEG